MEKMKKSVLKGFTLVELLVVMAIFSVLMVGALALTTPVSRMYKNTALAEKTYSYSHNIQEYIQNALEYSDNLYIYTTDTLGTEYSSDLQKLAEDYRKDHYQDMITYDGSSERAIRGKVYIMRLLNKPDNSDASNPIPAGQIVLYEYGFKNNAIDSSCVTKKAVLNPTYFNANDSKYSFSYALGASKLVGVPTPSGASSVDSYKALKSDLEDGEKSLNITPKNLSVSIVLDKDVSKQGYIDITGAKSYRAFKAPVAVQVANLPLTNINSRGGGLNPKGEPRIIKKSGTIGKQSTLPVVEGSTTPECGWGFVAKNSNNVDFNNDIYFVYSYADELK